MKLDEVHSHEDLRGYLRYFTNAADDSNGYDFMAAYRLFLAIAENLGEHGLKANLSGMADETTDEQAEFLLAVATFLSGRRAG